MLDQEEMYFGWCQLMIACCCIILVFLPWVGLIQWRAFWRALWLTSLMYVVLVASIREIVKYELAISSDTSKRCFTHGQGFNHRYLGVFLCPVSYSFFFKRTFILCSLKWQTGHQINAPFFLFKCSCKLFSYRQMNVVYVDSKDTKNIDLNKRYFQKMF